MSLICIRSQTPESDGNAKPTREKAERNPLDVPLDQIAKDLLSFFKGCECFNKLEEKIQKKYDIKKEHEHNCWPEDDIKRAWGKIQRMGIKSDKRKHWSIVTILQMVKRSFVCGECKLQAAQENRHATTDEQGETTSSLEGNSEERSSQTNAELEGNSEERSSQSNAELEGNSEERSSQSNAELEGNSEERSSQSNAELETVGDAGGVKQLSGRKCTSSAHRQPHSLSQGQAGRQFQGRSQDTGNSPGAPDGQDRACVALQNKEPTNIGETIYIRIPFSVMFRNEQILEVRQDQPDESGYKLINKSPSAVNGDFRKRKSYAMSFNNDKMNANWVYEILNTDTLADNDVELRTFRDPYHRGHLAAARNHRWCQEAFKDTNLNSNIVPQHKTLNNSLWKKAENRCRDLCRKDGVENVHVYSGPLYRRPMNPLRFREKEVPSHLFKVIIVENEDGTVDKPECYVFPNGKLDRDLNRNLDQENLGADLEEHRKTIEYIQRVSGLTFIERRPNVRGMNRTIMMELKGQEGNRAPRYTARIQVKNLSFF